MSLAILLLTAQSWQAEVNLAIDRGIEHVLSFQRANGDFPVGYSKNYPMGPAALGVYALLKSGMQMDHPALRRAFAFLDSVRPNKTYSTACMMLAYGATSDPRNQVRLQKFLDKLLEWQKPNGTWAYPGGTTDLSNTQYAALGLPASPCLSCASPVCTSACPGGIDIPSLARDTHRRLA